ncbi:MAG: N-acetyltransferase family protein, partial [Dehalococcoidia bacterium]
EQEQCLKTKQSEYSLNVETGYSFVAEGEDGRIAGFVLAFESMPFKGTVHIRHIGVHPNSQRESVGLQLYQQVIEQAKLNGIVEMRALINLDNAPSLRLHAKAGFSLQERVEARLSIEGS